MNRKTSTDRFVEDDIRRFWDKVSIPGPNECWLWTASVGSHGYGQIRVAGRTRTAHTISWIIHNGDVSEGLFVCHDCPGGDNRACVNPKHLWLGNAKRNSLDAARKGTLHSGDEHRNRMKLHAARGQDAGSAKLTEDQVRWIRKIHAAGDLTQKSIAGIFDVQPSTISDIVSGVTWSHVS